MGIVIYDIDGTLTYLYGDIPDATGYDTYAFWPLISYNFASDATALRKDVANWDESMKTESDPTGSSHKMMQASINTFIFTACADAIRKYAKAITLEFVKCGVLRVEAIQHLERNLEEGNTCVLSTGSYQDGAYGFVDGLIESRLLSPAAGQKILISGAIVDWGSKTLIHANVRERKIAGLENVFKKKIGDFKNEILAVFADDPWINDRDILALAPFNSAYVIETKKNSQKPIPDFCRFTTWAEIVNRWNYKPN
jgi:hypothetical protein